MRVLVAFFLLLAAACVTGPSEPLSLERRFELVAFHSEDGRTHPIIKWVGRIPYRIEGDERYRQMAEDTILEVAAVAGLKAVKEEPARLVVHILPYAQAKPLANALAKSDNFFENCSGHIRDHHLSNATVVIRNDLGPRQTRVCLLQEISQSMGLINDLDGRTDTVFTSGGTLTELSDADRKLFEILFHRRVGRGYSKERVMPIVREIIAERWPEEALP